MKELILLRIKNLIASKEFNTAEANRELALDGWQTDHSTLYNMYEAEIQSLIEQYLSLQERNSNEKE